MRCGLCEKCTEIVRMVSAAAEAAPAVQEKSFAVNNLGEASAL